MGPPLPMSTRDLPPAQAQAPATEPLIALPLPPPPPPASPAIRQKIRSAAILALAFVFLSHPTAFRGLHHLWAHVQTAPSDICGIEGPTWKGRILMGLLFFGIALIAI